MIGEWGGIALRVERQPKENGQNMAQKSLQHGKSWKWP